MPRELHHPLGLLLPNSPKPAGQAPGRRERRAQQDTLWQCFCKSHPTEETPGHAHMRQKDRPPTHEMLAALPPSDGSVRGNPRFT